MDVFHFALGQDPKPIPLPTRPLETGWLWLDVVNDESTQWVEEVERLAGVRIHEGHIRDSQNPMHPSFYDATRDYDMVVFRSLASEITDGRFDTQPAVFFLMPRMLVTVRPVDSRSVATVRERLRGPLAKRADSPQSLMHIILNAITDRFLALREELSEQMDIWAEQLLDPDSGFDDWRTVLGYRTQMRRLLTLGEAQEDAIVAWRSNTQFEPDESTAVRYTDLLEHIRRVISYATEQENEVEALVQLHFSAISLKTNEIVRVLTVISAIFLPLTLVAGLFGMNFGFIPGLRMHYGFLITLGAMVGLAAVLLVLFRIKRWI